MDPQIANQMAVKIAHGIAPIILIVTCVFIAWIVCIIDLTTSKFKDRSNKITWALLLVLVAPLGTILYMIFSTGQKEINTKDFKKINNIKDNEDTENEYFYDEQDRINCINRSKEKYSGEKEKWF